MNTIKNTDMSILQQSDSKFIRAFLFGTFPFLSYRPEDLLSFYSTVFD